MLSTMQQHFYQNPSQMVNLPADDFANLANYFNVPSPTAMPSFSPMNMGGPINGNTQPSYSPTMQPPICVPQPKPSFNFDQVPRMQKRVNPAVQELASQKSNCPACRGKHRAHTCGRGTGRSSSNNSNKSNLSKRKKPPPRIGTNFKHSKKHRGKNIPSINVEQINQEPPGSTRTMGQVLKITNF